jgi:hypothetical protein
MSVTSGKIKGVIIGHRALIGRSDLRRTLDAIRSRAVPGSDLAR